MINNIGRVVEEIQLCVLSWKDGQKDSDDAP